MNDKEEEKRIMHGKPSQNTKQILRFWKTVRRRIKENSIRNAVQISGSLDQPNNGELQSKDRAQERLALAEIARLCQWLEDDLKSTALARMLQRILKVLQLYPSANYTPHSWKISSFLEEGQVAWLHDCHTSEHGGKLKHSDSPAMESMLSSSGAPAIYDSPLHRTIPCLI